jgi:hypothetical protein
MRARMMRSPRWAASLLVGLCMLTVSCGASTLGRAIASPTLTPSPSPTATISPTATSVVFQSCRSDSGINPWVNPPGPLPTTILVPPGTLVGSFGMSMQVGRVAYYFCTPGATPAGITAFMDSALPAAGWMRHSVPACGGTSYDWYKGIYGMNILFDLLGLPPDEWVFDFCPHVGQY